MSTLKVENLHVEVEGKEVLKGVTFEVKSGEIHALMGPNGSGKTTLSLALMGHPKYKITKGSIILDGEDITNLETDEKVKRGLFLAFQNPIEISGVKLSTLLVAEYNRISGSNKSVSEIVGDVRNIAKSVGLNETLLNRGVFDGFSGGEKKRTEILQMLLMKPKFAILDEPDSGVDVDGLRIISEGIKKLRAENNTGYVIITHYRRILDYVNADKVHVLYRGTIIASGGMELAKLIDEKGYEGVIKSRN
ncbi:MULTISPECIES: Fe-S cluster assembly ATPase SufC [Metallosphaera]|uniref:Iron-regulated ABC transporter ATPase subunit SufC n=3 Tax=Metallosphaera TaxID=41980 RepID=A4YHB1_METS5|nr:MULTISPECIES: Fe-S cluster assembly ATPase SufC [Metallosphaera]ABP95813.1 Iron-regulated ABC transporter ATPase subunit SufC [Metallosphaera sedula DSM 5348]AIM27797.1 Iron-regulated ABC transporter ATPase subunit SufC [Metallosphaera sedula]AKV74646.1 ABC transporter ATP-binding protein [Metallosphaera sedula]AKV76883.1 ABC transporter ATP-binding protein [Metallosphaera sedula]AKV79134.1 ABC transporter ATP-binding protein [Metallosphaera sedula]